MIRKINRCCRETSSVVSDFTGNVLQRQTTSSVYQTRFPGTRVQFRRKKTDQTPAKYKFRDRTDDQPLISKVMGAFNDWAFITKPRELTFNILA